MTQYLTQLAAQFPGIFRLNFAGYPVTFISSPDLVAELGDAKRFRKLVGPPLSILRALAGDGLFTAHSEEPNWHKAHRILVPAFGQRAMRGYYELMVPIAQQLMQKWQSKGEQEHLVTEEMTRYTLEVIGRCGFGYRFGLFDSEAINPFTQAMHETLTEAMERLTRIRFPTPHAMLKNYRFKKNIRYMHRLVDEVIAQRRLVLSQEASQGVSGTRRTDLLELMLQSKDPETGKTLSDENIRFQVITFLIAGHETTSGLLSFALYYLVKHPEILAKVRNQIDSVIALDQVPTYDQLAQLPLLDAVLKETLRLWPTAPMFSVAPFEDTVIGGRFPIEKDHRLYVLLPGVHRDRADWSDPEVFDIERFSPENELSIRACAYKPFGQGERACIGRQFAYTEARLLLALLLRRFELHDPHDYQLQVQETLSLKPQNFKLKTVQRTH